MTLSEFKAWFEGYTEGIEGVPTAAQFARIKEKVKAIDGTPITQTIFMERYRPYWDRSDFFPRPVPVWYGTSAGTAADNGAVCWNSESAMMAVGRTDALLEAN